MPNWKRAERRVAKAVGGERRPVRGRGEPDVVAPGLDLEVKYRRALPRWLKEAVEQASGRRRSLKAAVLLERGKHIDSALVVMKMREFRRLLRRARDEGV